jgi:choice-of-anchor C domain-containing protein
MKNVIIKQKLIKRIMLSGMAAILSVPLIASANLVVDGSFEQQVASDPFQTFNSVSTMGGWTVAAGSVDLIRSYWQPAAGSQSVDMAGFFANGTIQQTINGLANGGTYHLSFDMAGNPDNNPNGYTLKTIRVSLGASFQDFTFDTTGKTHVDMGWVSKAHDFVATSSSMVLSFQDLSAPPGTAFGAVIDNVSLVPEPTTMLAGALLLFPFGVSTLRTLRKNRMA